MKARFCVAGLVSVMFSAAAIAASVPQGADSPEALAARLQAAAKKKDGYELAACTVPEDRDMVAGSLVFGTSMMTGFMGMDDKHKADAKKYQTQLDGILKKHGVDKNLKDPGALPKKDGEPDFSALVKGADTIALSGDLMKFMRSLPGVTGEGPFAEFTTISDIKADGDKATAKGSKGPIELVKVGGRWYVHLSPNGGGGGGPDGDESSGAKPSAD